MRFATGGWASAHLKAAQCFFVVNATANNAPGPCDGPSPGSRFSGASQNNNGYYIGGGFDYMVHKGPMVDVILGLEYQKYDVRRNKEFYFNSSCASPTGTAYALGAT